MFAFSDAARNLFLPGFPRRVGLPPARAGRYNTRDMTESLHHAVTVALPTLGCKANRYDSDTLARALIARGYVIVPDNTPADVYIVIPAR